ncbi:heme oxygenase [Pseudomonas sp. IC_126]|uniref:biliverdin-producing heme oxygenase n=1 Tax=Pseudomonas sp. IC_126 TaxID=2547400 RepID=UPI0010393F61|nr:biliverdin-producing heme oxygenase [Pseudomonas sp. IC_126]TCD22252.1 heme oxygenase [Pseudomonas sp. IC_126]
MSELRARLRHATAPLHAQVDAAYAGFDFNHEGGYVHFLRAHSRALGAVEVALEQAGIVRLLNDWPTRTRRHLLLADLSELDSPAPTTLPLPELLDEASCWGAAYVLEGSRLGGRILAKRQRQFDPSAPVSYLEHGDVARLWPTFLARLETAGCSSWPAILAAAEATFALFMAGAALEQASTG